MKYPVFCLVFALLQPALPAGVLAHFPFDTDFNDASGSGRHASLIDQGIAANTGIVTTLGDYAFGSGGMTFGNEGDYLSIPEISFADTDRYTIAFWAKRNPTAQVLCIVAGDVGNKYDFISIFTDGRGVRFRDSQNRSTDIGWAPNDTNWHHYAFVFGPTSDSSAMSLTLHVDGQSGVPVQIPGGQFRLNAIGSGYSTSGYDWRGEIDEFWVFDEALTASQVNALYQSNSLEGYEPPHPEPVTRLRVVLQAGQSNSDGRAGESRLPTSPVNLQAPQLDVDVYHQPESSDVSDGYDELPAGQLTVLQPGLSRKSSEFGPEITLGRSYADLYAEESGTRVAIIKYARGGTNLASQWRGGGDATKANDGLQYQIFQSTVEAGLAALAAAYPEATVELEGLIWMQGESDANVTSYANAYEANLEAFLSDVRLTYGADLPVIVGRLSLGQTALDHELVVRAAQDAVVADDPRSAIVNTDDLGLQADQIHFDADGQMELGRRFAETLAYYAWMAQNFLPDEIDTGIAEPLADLDADGQDNRYEFIAGSDPASSDSRFELAIEFTGSAEAELQVDSVTTRCYAFELYDEANQLWESITSDMRGNNARLSHKVEITAGAAIFRVRACLP